ncbi:MAG: hypothetical protein AAF432_11305 [Planctomycetota bacterium]
MLHRTHATIAAAVGLTAGMLLTGCHSPKGGMMPSNNSSYTYYSTETVPKSVTMIDLRTNEEVFSIDIPAGKQLTFDFVEGAGDDPVYRPDLMRYMIWDIGTSTGKLRRSLTVPASFSRRVDIAIRPGPEYKPAEPGRELRSDEVGDRPEWWTPTGGDVPTNNQPFTTYDG